MKRPKTQFVYLPVDNTENASRSQQLIDKVWSQKHLSPID